MGLTRLEFQGFSKSGAPCFRDGFKNGSRKTEPPTFLSLFFLRELKQGPPFSRLGHPKGDQELGPEFRKFRPNHHGPSKNCSARLPVGLTGKHLPGSPECLEPTGYNRTTWMKQRPPFFGWGTFKGNQFLGEFPEPGELSQTNHLPGKSPPFFFGAANLAVAG